MTKEAKAIPCSKNIVYSINAAGEIRHPHTKKLNLDINLTPLLSFKSKWIIDINRKHTMIKLLKEDNIEEVLDDFGFVNDFLEIMPR